MTRAASSVRTSDNTASPVELVLGVSLLAVLLALTVPTVVRYLLGT